jgi:hypothetical protein
VTEGGGFCKFPGMRSVAILIKARAAEARSFIKASPPLVRAAVVVGPLLLILMAVFFNALRHSKSGEIASALGSFIGGLVGASGAVWAVFLTLSQQRREETAKVAEAVRTEVSALVKYAIGAVGICERIKKGLIQVPRQDAHYIVKNFAGDPIIYPAVADRGGLLPRADATAQFYIANIRSEGHGGDVSHEDEPSGHHVHSGTSRICHPRICRFRCR